MLTSAGCSSAPQSKNKAIASSLFAVIATPPATQAIDASTLFTMQAGEEKFTLLDQHRQAGEAIIIRRETTTEHTASIASSEGERRTEFLKLNDDGSIALTATIDRNENALTIFEPPLTICPPSLPPNQPFSSESAMRVVALDNPKKQREKGTAKRTIAYPGNATIRTPRGEELVAQIEVHFEADLRFADANERTTQFVSRGDGLIVQESTEKVTILGAFPRETKRTLLREK